MQPELLLLDEPFAALDAPTRLELISDLQSLFGETVSTTVMVTHDLDEARALSSRIAVMPDGRIAQCAAPSEVLRAPASPAVARFVGMHNLLVGRVVAAAATGVTVVGPGLRDAHAGGDAVTVADREGVWRDEVVVGVRPEDVTVAPAGSVGAVTGPLPGRNGRIELRGRVVRSMPEGALRRVTVDCGVPLVALMPGERHDRLAAGDDVSVSFAADAAHVMAHLSKDATSR